jgi:hypothetical protein
MCFRWAAATLLGAALFAVACYSPNIGPASYACGTDGGCPDKFHCAWNHLCYPAGDAGVPPACESDASVQQVCSTVPASGQSCNPGCQNGCNNCGWCAVLANGVTKCLTESPGSKKIGDICDPSLKSSCLPGLYCQPECNSGRCYRFCDVLDKNACGTGSTCSIAGKVYGDGGTLSFELCSLVSTCDAVTQKGCDLPFACYPTGLTPPTECDCPETVTTGQPCGFRAQCVRGDSCVGPAQMSAICLQTCLATSDCTSGTCMNPANTAYGYCL